MPNALQKCIDFVNRLGEHGIHYRLSHTSPFTIMVEIAIPGERWEVEFFANGDVWVETFITTVDIYGEEKLGELFGSVRE